MIPRDALLRAGLYVAVVLALRFVEMLFGWAERRGQPAVMNERINSGSDRYFQEERDREREAALSDEIDLPDF